MNETTALLRFLCPLLKDFIQEQMREFDFKKNFSSLS
jgi:hypothetical protein